MKIFLDTGDINKIKFFSSFSLIDGVTTNPSIIANTKKNFISLLEEICAEIDGPISAEVTARNYEGMIEEGLKLSKLNKNIVVKIPATLDGYRALSFLSSKGIKTNFTLIYTVNQAMIAAKLGATYVSPFIGRLDANGNDGTTLMTDIKKSFENYNFNCQILAASLRNVIYAKEALKAGVDVITVTPDVLELMMFSELSELTLEKFLLDWNKLSSDQRKI